MHTTSSRTKITHYDPLINKITSETSNDRRAIGHCLYYLFIVTVKNVTATV